MVKILVNARYLPPCNNCYSPSRILRLHKLGHMVWQPHSASSHNSEIKRSLNFFLPTDDDLLSDTDGVFLSSSYPSSKCNVLDPQMHEWLILQLQGHLPPGESTLPLGLSHFTSVTLTLTLDVLIKSTPDTSMDVELGVFQFTVDLLSNFLCDCNFQSSLLDQQWSWSWCRIHTAWVESTFISFSH